MDYTVNLGCWGSIFAVPTDVVDKYLKIAGSAQLKVLLYILRRSGEQFSARDIASALNMDQFDVKDCVEFWSSFGVIAVNSGEITPPAGHMRPAADRAPVHREESTNITAQNKPVTAHEQSALIPERPAQVSAAMQPHEAVHDTVRESANESPKEAASQVSADKPSDTVIARPLRPDPIYVAKRVSEDKEIESLLNEAQYILGRPVSPNENAGLIMLHDNDGLPCEVILMLLTYGASNQKGMRQIEAMGAGWAKEGILTLEQADEKIRQLEESKEAYRRIQTLLGLEYRKASRKEEENYTRWLNVWKFSDEMIKEAYDICVNAKGKYIPNYVNTILHNWYESGIRTLDQVRAQKRTSGSNTPESGHGSSFDPNDLSSLSMFND